MAELLTARLIPEPAELGTESYRICWQIYNWPEVRQSKSLVKGQEAVFETASSPSAWFKTKWLVGLKIVNAGHGSNKKIRIYWKLLDITGPQSIKLEVKLQMQLWDLWTDEPHSTDEISREVKLLEIVEGTNEYLQFQPDSSSIDTDSSPINSAGKIMYVLKLTLKTPPMTIVGSDCFKMEQFSRVFMDQLRQNQAALLNDSETADLKILTSDEVEIRAHKAILKAQCPVFGAMFNCDLSEKATGTIRLTDISGKTIKIVLHYFYVGELLPSWRDPDTIVEFTYAAGKYQMAKVLELLDDMLGRNSEEASVLDTQLINLAGKLKLENAEARLLDRIVARIKKVTTSDELFRLFGFEEQDLSDEKDGESWILATMDDLHGYGNSEPEVSLENGMAMLAMVQKKGLKRLEKNLLECFAVKAELVENAEELFELFGQGKQMEKREGMANAPSDN